MFNGQLGTSMQEFLALPRDRAAALVRDKIPDLLHFLRHTNATPKAAEPRRTQALAARLEKALCEGLQASALELQSLRDRIIADGFMRSELDRDQNVYLGPFFTRKLTRATPDLVFQPATLRELERALVWARKERIGIATRGAGSTAMGGAVPNDGGLLLELSRFDQVQVDRQDGVAAIGAGARFKNIHTKLAAEGMALKSYPSNLGGTLGGWFSAGGTGLNTFKHGPVQQQVRALSMVLPRGEHVRFHDDGRLDVLSSDGGSRRLTTEESDAWMREQGYPPLHLGDLAQTEGQFGVILTFTMAIAPLPRFTPFYFEFASDADALRFVHGVVESLTKRGEPPANLKYLSAAHVEAVYRIRGETAREAKPAVYLDFESIEQAQRFESGLDAATWRAHRDDAEARRWFGDRFRPQQTKRLGPGFLAAEILMPAKHVEEFQACAVRLAARVGVHLETEVYFFGDGRALALPGYLSRGPRRGFVWELLLAPILLDLAMSRFQGEPYVLGRWQSPYFRRKVGKARAKQLRRAKKRIDPGSTLNPGVFFGPSFRVAGMQGMFRTHFPRGVRTLRRLYGSPIWGVFFKAAIGAQRARVKGSRPAAAASAADRDALLVAQELERQAPPMAELVQAVRGCVNCGECNSVCPIFHDAKIRLPQMLTHIGEGLGAKRGKREPALGATQELLLDLCMRCGNCQEVCQADIPHLDLYAALEERAGDMDAERRERHVALLSHLRHSEGYLRDFLNVRPGGYLQRTPASLTGEVRFLLFRAENESGPENTCIHCGACVSVCPTSANLEFQEGDARRITTELARCIGCGTCVEVCPANLKNGGHTLRVMEAPTREFFEAVDAFEARVEGSVP